MTTGWKAGIRDSLIFAPCIETLSDVDALHDRIAYAKALGKPFRILLWPTVRLPEVAFAGVTDLQVHRWETAGDAASWLERCVEEVEARETS